jgi:predicted ABC-type transport system involved in lysophospholipase L1 biosynthesis ATPase subunit
VNPGAPAPAVLRLGGGLTFGAGDEIWRLAPLALAAGEWVVLRPAVVPAAADPAPPLARVLATVTPAGPGVVEVLGHDPGSLAYLDLQRLRARLGYVQSSGGLLSNRTIRENIALPVQVHAGLDQSGEEALVGATLARFDLERVAGRRPHEVDTAVQWRARVARALVLAPAWIVLEGPGNWVHDRGHGVGWTRLLATRQEAAPAAALCLSRPEPDFEAWFEANGGRVVRFEAASRPAATGERRDEP